MSAEAFTPPEVHRDREAKIRAVEVASENTVRLRTLIAELEQRLGLEYSKTADTATTEMLQKRLDELTQDLELALAFIEEFDPLLYRKLKDIS